MSLYVKSDGVSYPPAVVEATQSDPHALLEVTAPEEFRTKHPRVSLYYMTPVADSEGPPRMVTEAEWQAIYDRATVHPANESG